MKDKYSHFFKFNKFTQYQKMPGIIYPITINLLLRHPIPLGFFFSFILRGEEMEIDGSLLLS